MSAAIRWTPEQEKAYLSRRSVASLPTPQPKPRKHRNEPTMVDGERVDSKKEARRLSELRMLGRAGHITELARQVEFFLGTHTDDQGHSHLCVYRADAVWKDDKGVRHVEDTKSEYTRTLPVYRLKRRLMKALLGIEIEEV